MTEKQIVQKIADMRKRVSDLDRRIKDMQIRMGLR